MASHLPSLSLDCSLASFSILNDAFNVQIFGIRNKTGCLGIKQRILSFDSLLLGFAEIDGSWPILGHFCIAAHDVPKLKNNNDHVKILCNHKRKNRNRNGKIGPLIGLLSSAILITLKIKNIYYFILYFMYFMWKAQISVHYILNKNAGLFSKYGLTQLLS